MRRFGLTSALAVAAALAWAAPAAAQTNALNSFGGYPTPQPYSQAPGSYVVAPSLPGAGGTYGYVQQNFGPAAGGSPNGYYSANYFTSTPMSYARPYAYQSGYRGYTPLYARPYAAPTYSSVTPRYYSYSRSYGPSYYQARPRGVFRRWFGFR